MTTTEPAESTLTAPPPRRARAWWRAHGAAVAVAAVALVANAWALTSVGWGNRYYAAAVRSMGSSWRNFVYASFDPGGFVSVDKPPLSLWAQVVSTKLLGYNQLAVLLPSALAATGAVALLYVGLRPIWGRTAGLVAAALLALTPISVAVAHSNNTDAVLVAVMTAAAVAAVRAVQLGRLRWLLAAAALGGSAMTAKMLAGVPVLPGILVAYLWCAPREWRVRLGHVAAAAAVMAVAGLWWFVAVDLTPADQRPYVGSSATNSAFQLAFERNGVNQVDGGLPGGAPAGPPAGAPLDVPAGGPGGAPRPGGVAPGAPAGGGLGFAGGEPGWLRLFNAELGGQAGWVVPFALVGSACALWSVGLRPSARLGALVVFGGWFLSAAGAFSVTQGIVHPYYLANLGPPLAALAGIAAASWRRDLATGHVRLLGLPVALGLTVWADETILGRVEWAPALRWVVALGCGAAAIGAVVAWSRGRGRLGPAVVAAALVAVALAPALWTGSALARGFDGGLPFAYPVAAGLQPRPAEAATPGEGLVTYLEANRQGERWALAVERTMQADGLVIDHGLPVMALGGFSGGDPILTVPDLQRLLDDGDVRFFLLSAPAPGGPGARPAGGPPGGPPQGPGVGTAGGTARLTAAVARACRPAPGSVVAAPARLLDCQGARLGP